MNPRESSASCAWGMQGLLALLPESDVVIIVDVLSFSTAVDVAVSRGAEILPFALGRAGAEDFAMRNAAQLAWPRAAAGGQFSLSPASLAKATRGQRIVLPSPNGSALSERTCGRPTFAGCLRNARAVARAAANAGSCIAVIAAGEKWPDGSLRPAFEDLLGAGAILDALAAELCPDAQAARAVYRAFRGDCAQVVRACASGEELIRAGYQDDVACAVAENVSTTAPRLIDGAYRDNGDSTGEVS